MLPNPAERLNKQCNVISSTIDRKAEFKTNQTPHVNIFHHTLKQIFTKTEIESLWEEF